jgi:hypothetical protein
MIKKQTIMVDGGIVGFQFNQKSMGYRTFRGKTVQTEDEKTGSVYISALQRAIRVRRVQTTQIWEAY